MDFLHENASVGSIVEKKPDCAIIFEKLGIDYCCKGNKTLKEVCDEKKLNTLELLKQLGQTSNFNESLDWDRMSLQEIIEHIVDTYHTHEKQELPRISQFLKKLNIKHGERYPYLSELQSVFEKMKNSLLEHMDEEETVVFPFILKLSQSEKSSQENAKNYLDSLNEDHFETGKELEKIKNLTHNYTPPPESCTTHKVMLNSLEQLEQNLHEHIHKENHILFPRVLNMR